MPEQYKNISSNEPIQQDVIKSPIFECVIVYLKTKHVQPFTCNHGKLEHLYFVANFRFDNSNFTILSPFPPKKCCLINTQFLKTQLHYLMRQLNIRIRQVESETSKVLNTFSFLFLKNKMNCITLRPNPSLLVY